MDDQPGRIPPRRRRAETVRAGSHIRGIIEWREPTIGLYPYHVTIYTHQGPAYLGVTSTRTAARKAIRDNT